MDTCANKTNIFMNWRIHSPNIFIPHCILPKWISYRFPMHLNYNGNHTFGHDAINVRWCYKRNLVAKWTFSLNYNDKYTWKYFAIRGLFVVEKLKLYQIIALWFASIHYLLLSIVELREKLHLYLKNANLVAFFAINQKGLPRLWKECVRKCQVSRFTQNRANFWHSASSRAPTMLYIVETLFQFSRGWLLLQQF